MFQVTARNMSSTDPILVNGQEVSLKTYLHNDAILTVLGKEYKWKFPKLAPSIKPNNIESENITDKEPTSSNSIAETPPRPPGYVHSVPSSCPELKVFNLSYKL